MSSAAESTSADQDEIIVRVKSSRPLPPDYKARLREFVRENPPAGCSVRLEWGSLEENQEQEVPPKRGQRRQPQPTENLQSHQEVQKENRAHPRGYRRSPQAPVFRGPDHCPHCLCTPCLIALPPDFLRGSCSAHPANFGKRNTLFSKFWRTLQDLKVSTDEEFKQRRAEIMARGRGRQEGRAGDLVPIRSGDNPWAAMPNCIQIEIQRRYPES